MTAVVTLTRKPTSTDLKVAAARARGVTGYRCTACGYDRHSVYMVDRVCNFAHPDVDNHDGEICGGELVEVAPTSALFTTPQDPRTEAYITGRFG